MTPLGKTAGDDQRKTHTALTTLFDDAGDAHRRRTDNGQINASGYIMERLKSLLTLNRFVLGIDGEQTTAKAGLNQVVE